MATESARHALYARLEEVLGDQHADTLMTHLPPGGPEQLATSDDVRELGNRFDILEGRFDRLEDRFDALQALMHDQLKTYTVTMIGAMTALTAIFGLIVTIIR
jgi:hypothetical protein